jgi:hypothetical protein
MTTALPLLAALLLDWSDPAGFVRDLADDAIAVRERAESELYRRGESIRPLLLDSLDAAPDPEVRARLRGLLARLDADDRIRWFGGHNRVCGFAAQLRSDRWYGSGPFRLTIEIMNVGSKDAVFPGIGTWDLETPDQESRATGTDAKIVVKKFIGHSGIRRTTWRPHDESARRAVLLRPGDVVRYESVVEAKTIPDGDYQISVEYYAPDHLPGAEERLRTNTVRVTVRK